MAVSPRKTMVMALALTLVIGMVRGKKEGLTQCHNLLGADGRGGEGSAVVFCRFSLRQNR